MQALVRKSWLSIRSSYWFFPALMSIAAILASIAAVWIDRNFDTEGWHELNFIYTSTPDAARTILATLAGSMITVAGVTFAITITTVGNATAQFGPRVLTNFMRDRGNQISLGAFVANFLYCLFVLRSVRSAVDSAEADIVFIPQIAILVALASTIGCVGVLIYYIHHVPYSLHVSNLLAYIGTELQTKIEKLFPEEVGQALSKGPDHTRQVEAELAAKPNITIHSKSTGFLQLVDNSALMDLANEHDLIIIMKCRPGDFIIAGQTIAFVYANGRNTTADDLNLQDALTIGYQRTPDQDVRFLVNELVEIATRALSTGQNDPFTAIDALHWLTAGLTKRISRQTPSPYRMNDNNELRVVATPATIEEMIDMIYDQLRPYAVGDRNVGLLFMTSINTALAASDDMELKSYLRKKGETFRDDVAQRNWHASDVKQLGEVAP